MPELMQSKLDVNSPSVFGSNIAFEELLSEEESTAWNSLPSTTGKLFGFLNKGRPTEINTERYNLVDSEDELVEALILRLRTTLSIKYRDAIALRLNELFHIAKEEDSASPGIDIDSLRAFYNFLQHKPKINMPSITLSPDNQIVVSWEEHGRSCDVHFLSIRTVSYLISKTNDLHPDRMDRLAGLCSTDTLVETLNRNEIIDLISE